MAAQIPDAPTGVSTEFVPDEVTISWTEPSSRGSPLLSYKVYIKKHDGTYAQELSNCDGSDAIVMSQTSCTIPVENLRIAPFVLPWGSVIDAKVIATNAYGDSFESAIGTGA